VNVGRHEHNTIDGNCHTQEKCDDSHCHKLEETNSQPPMIVLQGGEPSCRRKKYYKSVRLDNNCGEDRPDGMGVHARLDGALSD
jgi:hypothetical protein